MSGILDCSTRRQRPGRKARAVNDARSRCQQGSPAAVITTVERRLSHHRGVHVI